MRARGRLLPCLVTMVIALAGFVTAGALPAAAAPSTIQYVALGDSYAAGTAAAGSPPNCPHGDDGGYPALLDAESRIDLTANAACSGDTTSDVVDHQLSALNGDTRLVTLTAGAANLGLSDVLDACTNPQTPDLCRHKIGTALALLGDCSGGKSGGLDRPLADLYAEVAKAAPEARIVVTGYPLLFEFESPPPAGDPRVAINEATTQLTCVIERAVAVAKDDVNIYYVDVTEEFAGHGVVIPAPPAPPCTHPKAFIHSLLDCNTLPPREDPEAFHPMPAGYKAYADAIKTKLPNGWLDKPSP
jgi:lysophospholipase L1-like esterase